MCAVGNWYIILALYHEETEEDKQLGEETSQYKEGPEATCLCPPSLHPLL